MPRTIAKSKWDTYFAARFDQAMTLPDAAEHAGITRSTCWKLENDPSYATPARQYLAEWRDKHPPRIQDADHLCAEAKRALTDFAFFRLRYMGRPSKKWQIAAANQILALLETGQREFAVINCPPGSGKSTLFTHDIPCWLIARKRSIRIMIGSASESRARQYTEQILTTLERSSPAPLEDEQQIRGAVQAAACMQADFGRFKPENARRWRAGAFKVAQENDQVGTTKESTVVAVGLDTRFLGDRVDLAVWDDVVTEETTGTAEMREKVLRKWRNEAEKRIEKRGLLILQGQRIGPEDLYHSCLELKKWVDPGEAVGDDEARKYLHVIFKAHYDEHCDGTHHENDPEYDPFNPDAGGCLLDPVGLPYAYLMQEKSDDPRTYATVFQQEDMDPNSVLVNPLWVDGGEDPDTGEMFPGCWDLFRPLGRNPELASAIRPPLSVITVDSAPAKFWSIQRYIHDRDTDRSFLVDFHRARMKVTDALAYDKDRDMYTGVLEDFWTSAKEQDVSYPVTHLIFEANDAEVFFLDSQVLTQWASLRGVTVVKHTTHRNKTDPKFGVEALIPPVWKYGRLRLPGEQLSGSRKKVAPLVREVTRYPEAATTDCLMAQWFYLHRLPSLTPTHIGPYRRAGMPTLRTLRRVS